MWLFLSQQNTEPYIVNLKDVDYSVLIIIIVGILIYTVLIAVIFTFALIKTQTFPPTSALVSALSLLTFIALSASIVTRSQALETIAATGVGAIAGALSTHITQRKENEMTATQTPDPEEAPQPEPIEEQPESEPTPEEVEPVVTDPDPHIEPAQAPGYPPRKENEKAPGYIEPAPETVENPMVEGDEES